MPTVSVIMAFHHVTPFLRPAVRSILDQTWRDFEFIIVDNGTGQGVAALGEEGHDPRVRVISFPENRGVAAAFNAARAEAQGEFLAHMDGDDLALPERLARQVATLRAEPDLAILSTHARVIDAAGVVRGEQFTIGDPGEQYVYSRYSLPMTNPTVMVRRAVADAFPFRPEFEAASDYDFFARVVERHRCRALPEVLLHYRRHPQQVTATRASEMVACACRIRLATARRRAGRPENLANLALPAGAPPAPADSYAHFAWLALAEDFPLLAVFLGRRYCSVRRSAGGLALATDVLGRAVVRAPREAATLVRMYLTGPVRTHGLHRL